MREPPPAGDPARLQYVAQALRERIYATLTGLSTVLVLLGYVEHTSAGGAAASLAVAMGGLWAASLFAEYVAHMGAHGGLPTARELRAMRFVAGQILETATFPLLAVAAAALGWWTLRTGLVVASVGLVLTLVVISVFAVRRTALRPLARVLIVLGELAIGVVVVAVKLLAH